MFFFYNNVFEPEAKAIVQIPSSKKIINLCWTLIGRQW